MRYLKRFCVIPALLMCCVPVVADIPPHPDGIEFPPLEFEPPKAADYKHTLSNGVVVYLAPSNEFPLVNVVFTFKGGNYIDPADRIGLADATCALIRRGGTASKSPQELDEELDFLAANVSTSCGSLHSYATLNCLTSNFGESFALFIEMLREPGFASERFKVHKDQTIEAMKQRNDHAQSILSREWNALLYGRDHFEAAVPTKTSIDLMTIDDLRSMHKRIFHPTPGHLIVAVNGDFEPQEMLSQLERAFEGLEQGEALPTPPSPVATLEPGIYHVEKDIPQGKVNIGLRGMERDNPDFIPTVLMNHILGGGGFTSRIINSVRSDEGLAYSAGSAVVPNVYYPGEFFGFFQSKNRTVALATKLIFDEFNRIRNELVTEEELNVAKNSLIETFPRTFESKAGMLSVFVNDELTNRPKDFWKNYRDKVKAVTVQDIQRVAQKYVVPDQMAIMVVGKWEEIAPGDLAGRASMSEFFDGNVTHLPLRDPLTLKPME